MASILDESSTARMRMAFTEKRDMFGAMAAGDCIDVRRFRKLSVTKRKVRVWIRYLRPKHFFATKR